jgi:uncharacterized protein (TIGR03437 family)
MSASIGAYYWTTANDQNPYEGIVVFQDTTFLGTDTSIVRLAGATAEATLYPLPNPAPAYAQIIPEFGISGLPASVLLNGNLPAALPEPPLPSSASLQFYTSVEGATANFSYTGQSCPKAPAAAPTITSGGVVPIYSATPVIQPGEWVSIYGSNLASSAVTWSGDFPISLGGTSVSIDGKPAYLWFVSPTQINLQVPADSATGSVPVIVTTSAGSSSAATVTLAQFAPSFSLLDSRHVTGIILRTNGQGAYGGGSYDIIGPTGSSLGYGTVAAKAGDTIILFGVGFGPTNPEVAPGQSFSGAAPTTSSVTLNINGMSVNVTFAGLSSAGLYQINLTLPANLGTGDVSLQASVGGVKTQAGVVISLQ